MDGSSIKEIIFARYSSPIRESNYFLQIYQQVTHDRLDYFKASSSLILAQWTADIDVSTGRSIRVLMIYIRFVINLADLGNIST